MTGASIGRYHVCSARVPRSLPPRRRRLVQPHASPRPPRRRRRAWPAIRAGRHTLVAAPTGSGKTLTAFLAALDDLVRQGLEPEGLPDETTVVYVSPLKALSNDIRLNLRSAAGRHPRTNWPRWACRTSQIRTRGAHRRHAAAGTRSRACASPPHILVTTPESLYVLLGSASGREMLVDGAHA